MKRLFAIGIVLLSLMGCGSRNAQKSTESISEINSEQMPQSDGSGHFAEP
ncbi:MAG: hypothetical protein MR784_02000 [Rikenellaceae bacterium]|nr:hypothetical protein [Rikenellaceae bacterium]